MPIIYPPVVLAHIVKNMEDYFAPKLQKRNSAEIHFSAQLNSYPHLGTLTSLSTAFAVGEYIFKTFKKPVLIKFEALDNAPTDKIKIGDKEYCKMHCHSLKNNIKKSEIYMDSFLEIFDYFSKETEVNYAIEYYSEFQKNPFVRKKLLEIINREDEFLPFISPSEKRLRIRFPCPKCDLMEKTAFNSKITKRNSIYNLTYSSSCPKHGKYNVRITPTNGSLVDFNTPLRNVIKEAKFIEEAKKRNCANIMVDGGDWTFMAFQIIPSLGLMNYKIEDLPLRVFSPIIEDWSGAKFSKSIYVKEGTYSGIQEEFLNYTKFQKTFGKFGMGVILNESRDWMNDPKKLLRNYSVEYFRKVFNT